MAAIKETAEEQLLRMIEGPEGASSKRPTQRFSVEKLLEPLQGSFEAVRQWVLGSQNRQERSDVFLWQLRFAGRFFWVIVAGLTLYLLVDLLMIKPTIPRLPSGGMPQPSNQEAADSGEALRQQAAEYRQTLAARNPFRLANRILEAPTGQTAKNRLVELTSTLVIVGINRGAVPEALIEDTGAKHTYFVKVGDQINGVTIASINQTGVTVRYEGEEILLK
jgi:hypothetical protein